MDRNVEIKRFQYMFRFKEEENRERGRKRGKKEEKRERVGADDLVIYGV